MNISKYEIGKGVPKFFFLFLLFHGLYAFTPILRQTQICMYIDIVLVFYWASRMLTNGKSFFLNKNMQQVIRITFVILAISVVYKLTGYSTAKIGQCIRYFSFFSAIGFGWYFVKISTYKQKKTMALSYSAIILFNVIYNIIITMPFVARGMGTEEIVKSGGSSIPNFGDTSFTGFVFFSSVLYILFFCYKKGFKIRFLSLVLVGICGFYTIVCGMRGTTSVLLIFSLFLILMTKLFESWVSRQNNILFIVFVVVLVLLINMDTIADLFIQISPSERLAQRFRDVQETSEHGITEDSFTGRGSLFKISINSFLKSPFTMLFGIGEPLIEGSYAKAGISNHSDVIDTFARSGLLGVFLYARCFYLFYKEMVSLYAKTIYCTLFKIVFWIVPVYGLMKTIFWENFAIVTFIMLPLTLYLINTKKNARIIAQNNK